MGSPRVSSFALALGVGLAAAACGSDDRAGSDGGARLDGGADGGGADGVTPPEAPAAPSMAPCPDGWREQTSGDGIARCEPWPESGRADCGPWEMHLPGQAECTPIGTACPSGDFADDLPDGPVRYVRAGASGGDGSKARPFGTIDEALDGIEAGTTVALAAGTHEGHPIVPEGVTLHGACAEGTLLRGTPGSEIPGVVLLGGDRAGLRNLRVGESAYFGVVSIGTGTFVESAVVRQTTGAGVWVQDGGDITLREVAVRDVASADGPAEGIMSLAGSTVRAEGGVVERVEGIGVQASRGAAAHLERVAVVEVARASAGRGGAGIGVATTGGSSVEVRQVVVERAALAGLLAGERDSTLRGEHAVVRGLTGDASGFGQALTVQQGARLALERARVVDNRSIGAIALSGGRLELSDSVVEGTRPNAGGASGGGVEIQGGGVFSFERVLLSGNRRAALMVNGGEGGLQDVRIEKTREQADGAIGRGLSVGGGAHLQLARVAIEDNRGFGIYAADEGTDILGTDLDITQTERWSRDGQYGRGIEIGEGATAKLARVRVRSSGDVGIVVRSAGTELELTDLIVAGTVGRPDIAATGRALNVQRGAKVAVTRGSLRGSRNVAALFEGDGTVARLEQITIADVDPAPCADGGCGDAELAVGLGAYNGADVHVTAFRITDAEGCGVQLADAELTLRDGQVSGHRIGACIQVEDYDLDRLNEGVSYSDNEINLDSTTLPVPSTVEAGEVP